jgi:hypothetical protein
MLQIDKILILAKSKVSGKGSPGPALFRIPGRDLRFLYLSPILSGNGSWVTHHIFGVRGGHRSCGSDRRVSNRVISSDLPGFLKINLSL